MSELTPRETQVLELVAAGRDTKQIAAIMELSVRSVEVYRAKLARKARAQGVVSMLRHFYYFVPKNYAARLRTQDSANGQHPDPQTDGADVRGHASPARPGGTSTGQLPDRYSPEPPSQKGAA